MFLGSRVVHNSRIRVLTASSLCLRRKKKSLLTAAAEILQRTGAAFSANELIAKVQEAGLWKPQAGKTPANTLYAAILREMNTKENPRFARGEKKGTFQYAL